MSGPRSSMSKAPDIRAIASPASPSERLLEVPSGRDGTISANPSSHSVGCLLVNQFCSRFFVTPDFLEL